MEIYDMELTVAYETWLLTESLQPKFAIDRHPSTHSIEKNQSL